MHRSEEIGLRDARLLDLPQNASVLGKRAAFVHYLFVRVRRFALHFGEHVDAVAAFVAASLLALFSTYLPADAAEMSQRRHGSDMLAEMQSKSPANAKKKIMDESRGLPNTEAVLWKIEKPGVPARRSLRHNASFLFSHLRVFAEGQRGHRSIEIRLGSKSRTFRKRRYPAAMAKSGSLLVYTNGKTLNAELSAGEFKKVQRVVTKAGMPENVSGLLKPWLVSMLLSTSDCERKQVASGATVLDLRVAAEAQKNGLTVAGLETIESQLGALASIPDDQQIAMLKVGLKYIDRSDDMMETLVQNDL